MVGSRVVAGKILGFWRWFRRQSFWRVLPLRRRNTPSTASTLGQAGRLQQPKLSLLQLQAESTSLADALDCERTAAEEKDSATVDRSTVSSTLCHAQDGAAILRYVDIASVRRWMSSAAVQSEDRRVVRRPIDAKPASVYRCRTRPHPGHCSKWGWHKAEEDVIGD